MEKIIYHPIGIVHSPFKEPKGTPIQPAGGKNIRGTVEIFPEFVEGLKDLDGFSHIILISHFHLVSKTKLLVKPYMDDQIRGVFATRAPVHPNPIGISVVRLDGISGNILQIRDMDIIDGTPLLDIKPFVPQFDISEIQKIGWLKENVKKLQDTKDDERFLK